MRAHLLAIAILVPLAFSPALSNDWVSWDDPEALVENDALRSPGLLGWALTTDRMSHFQPLSWLVWAGVEHTFGPRPAAFHGLSLLVHTVNALLIYLLIVRVGGSGVAGLLGTLLYAAHPLRVEPVAWASAFPYLLATMLLLLATLAYLHSRIALASLAYAASLLARPVALAFPLVLLVLDVTPLRRPRGPKLLVEKIPLLLLSAAALALEASRRPFVDVARFGIGARLTLAAESVVAHAGRTLWPVRLTPLDPLPLEPRADAAAIALGALVLLGTGLAAWRLRGRAPAALAVWATWLFLAFPSLGLAPSGLQATADRYSYVPAVALAVGLGIWLARCKDLWRWLATAAIALLAIATYRQTLWWKDSVTLWGRATALDPANDLALYFEASALNEAGRPSEALARYEDVLRLVPDHAPARRDLARLVVREGDAKAEAGALEEALALYDRALDADPTSSKARENRAMALFQLGRYEDALPALRDAFRDGASRPEVAGALALLENARGAPVEAAAVLQSALERHPDDVALAHNLARLLATRPDTFPGRAEEALELAERVVSATSRRDPRALDTLALALHAAGSRSEALQIFEEAWRVARSSGDPALAKEIEAHARATAK